jgi:C4-dicarboxylate-specific signal transduction histidine kinase
MIMLHLKQAVLLRSSNLVILTFFQPFFTVKLTGHCTVLGLCLSFDIMKADDSRYKVISEEVKVSNLIIELPLSTQHQM